MRVWLEDGTDLGKVIELQDRSFVMDGGGRDVEYVADYEQITDIEGDSIRIHGRHRFEELREAGGAVAGEQRIPVSEEQLDVVKREREAGALRLRKRVITERKEISVPVQREEAYVERVPASEATTRAAEGAFQDETVSIPLKEEEVEVRKRAVTKEEVRVGKRRIEEEQRVADTVRREEVEVEGGRPMGEPDVEGRPIGSPDTEPLKRG
jgi:uncharacterized protein (TIGR02271 family)